MGDGAGAGEGAGAGAGVAGCGAAPVAGGVVVFGLEGVVVVGAGVGVADGATACFFGSGVPVAVADRPSSTESRTRRAKMLRSAWFSLKAVNAAVYAAGRLSKPASSRASSYHGSGLSGSRSIAWCRS